jgi:hypothetical protein
VRRTHCRSAKPTSTAASRRHVARANNLLGMCLCLIFSACGTPSKAPTIDEPTVRQGSREVETLHTENPPAGKAEQHAAATPSDSRCTKQLKQGYALRERIDSEYGQSRIAGTFRDRRDEFMTRWSREAAAWAAETKAVLLQIGGPTAKSRFQNAHAPIGMVNGDVGWNNIRNFLRTRLAALESICKAP